MTRIAPLADVNARLGSNNFLCRFLGQLVRHY